MSEPVDPYGGQPYQGPPPTGYPPASGYAASGYPASGYPASGYPASGYPTAPGYPGPYPPAAYAQPLYPPPPIRVRPLRPGTATAAAVLAFVMAGLLVVAALILFSSAQFVHDFGAAWSTDPHAITRELSVDAVVNLCAAALLVPGGVLLVGGKAVGQSLVGIGSIVVVAAAVYWIVRARSDYAGALVFAVVFGGLAVAAISVAYAPATRTWIGKMTAVLAEEARR